MVDYCASTEKAHLDDDVDKLKYWKVRQFKRLHES